MSGQIEIGLLVLLLHIFICYIKRLIPDNIQNNQKIVINIQASVGHIQTPRSLLFDISLLSPPSLPVRMVPAQQLHILGQLLVDVLALLLYLFDLPLESVHHLPVLPLNSYIMYLLQLSSHVFLHQLHPVVILCLFLLRPLQIPHLLSTQLSILVRPLNQSSLLLHLFELTSCYHLFIHLALSLDPQGLVLVFAVKQLNRYICIFSLLPDSACFHGHAFIIFDFKCLSLLRYDSILLFEVVFFI